MYYVYIYKDPITKIPFYVGKGKVGNNRHLDHLKESVDSTSNRWKFYKIKSIIDQGLTPEIEILYTNLDENHAYSIETSLIKQYGKLIDGSGSLTNIVDDARPPSQKGKPKSDEHKKNLSKAMTGKTWDDERKQKDKQRKRILSEKGLLKGRPKGLCHTDETKKKISQSKQGQVQSEESNNKRSATLTGKQYNQVTCPHCGKIGGENTMLRWHFDNCKFKEVKNENI